GETIVALANSQGGYILIGVQPQPAGGTGQLRGLEEPQLKEITEQVNTAAKNCHPPVPISGLQAITRDGKSIVVVRISNDLPYVYATDGCVLGRRGAQNESLSADAIYQRLIERSQTKVRELSDVGRPIVTYARLNWPYIAHITKDTDITISARFDPEKKAVEWQYVELRRKDEDHYQCTVFIPVEQPKELYHQREITGEIYLQLSDLALSGLRVDYFNALGEGRRPTGSARSTTPAAVNIERSTSVIVDTTINVDGAFRRREFFPYRHVELAGVIPELNRLDDVLNALNDLGIRVEKLEPEPTRDDKVFTDQVRGGFLIQGIKHTEAEELEVWLVVRGTKGQLRRQVELGRRKDTL
ncbi:MAG: ATP-binding protein, partial [Deltaproteobacteria bacterium]|nr:ATP-binding protein [Deltaproteobacteria bacterium]